MDPFTIMAVVGTGMQIYGAISGASQQQEAAEVNAEMKRLQAKELLERQSINEQLIREQSEDDQLHIGGSSFGSTGIGDVLKVRRITEENISRSRRDAEFKATMLRKGADIETSLASDQMTGTILTGIGTGISAGATAYSRYKAYSAPSEAKDLF